MQKLLTSLIIIFISGCASSYPCGEPNNGTCKSVTENYNNSFNDYTNPDDLPKDSSWFSSSNKSDSKPVQLKFQKYVQSPSDGSPLISKPTMLRVWLTPYTDNDNIFHEQSYEYMITDKGHWLYADNKPTANFWLKNVSIGQVDATNTKNNIIAPKGVNKTTPQSFLMDNPAFNALNNHAVPVSTTTQGTTKVYQP